MKKIFIHITAIAAIVLGSSGSNAANQANSFVLSPFIGGYHFDGVQNIDPMPIYGVKAGYNFTNRLGLEAIYEAGESKNSRNNSDVNYLNYRLEALYHMFPQNRLVPYLAAGYGGMRLNDVTGNIRGGIFDYGAGVKYFLTDNVALRGDVRHLIIDRGPTVNNYEYTLGLGFFFGGAKPAPPAPTTSLAVSPATITKGESATLNWSSNNTKSCDIQPGIGAVPISGSRVVTPADTTDYTLTCSGEGGSSSSRAGLTVSQPVQEAPLPKAAAAEPTPASYKYCITLHTEFDVDKAEIRPQYHDEIAKVGNFMKQYPTTTAVIEGHTDNVGDAGYNLQLSQLRAESVVNHLVDTFGIDRSRLTAVGYGASLPVADNATDAGRQANRRIEAIIDCAFDVLKATPPDRLCMGLNMEFDTDKADIKPQYHNEIAKVGDFMKQNPTTTAIIEGHTDNVGEAEYNMKLSKKRADNVVAYLVKNFGIETSRLEAKGYGETRRIAYNSTPEGRQKNRRINAIIDCVIKK